MSYLEDPRVFYAIERTLLAWIRTEIAILALAFLIKKFGVQGDLLEGSETALNLSLYFLCALVIFMSMLSFWQCRLSIHKLGEHELPSASSKHVVYFVGGIGVFLCTVISIVVVMI